MQVGALGNGVMERVFPGAVTYTTAKQMATKAESIISNFKLLCCSPNITAVRA